MGVIVLGVAVAVVAERVIRKFFFRRTGKSQNKEGFREELRKRVISLKRRNKRALKNKTGSKKVLKSF